MKRDDADLVERVRAGDDRAFAELIDRYRDVVIGTAFHYLKRVEDAQDAAQETFIQVYQRLNELRDPHRFAPWMRRMVVNRCLDFLRRRQREDSCIFQIDDMPLSKSRTLPSAAIRMDEAWEQRMFFSHALQSLSEKVRLTFTLCYISEYSHDEIAEFLEIPVGTVRSRLRGAKRQLREEMKPMASEMFEDVRPGPDWTHKVVEEALRRGRDAEARHARGEAIATYDALLAKLGDAEPDSVILRLTLQVLRQKDAAVQFAEGTQRRLALLSEALRLARALKDTKEEAELLVDIGRAQRSPGKGTEYFQAALDIFRHCGEVLPQAECLLLLGADALFLNDASTAARYISEATPLFAASGSHDWQGVCHALLEMLSQTASIGREKVLLWAGMCDVLETRDNVVRLVSQPGFQADNRSEEHPQSLFIGSVFWQLSALKVILNANVLVGDVWSGPVRSFSYQPLIARMTVIGDTEKVSVPAGTFDGCLLTELVTMEGSSPDAAPEQQDQLNRSILCGRRLAWYAPGVGLVQLSVERGDATEACIQLHEYKVLSDCEGYLPLVIGNAWTYGWADIPSVYTARETYTVTGSSGSRWHLAHAAFVYKGHSAGQKVSS